MDAISIDRFAHRTGREHIAGRELFPDQFLGEMRFPPMRDGLEPIFVALWDTNRTDAHGKSRLAYRLRDGARTIFESDDFHAGISIAIDAPEAFASIAGFLALQPGDTDEDYFANYTPAQLEWAEERGEELSLYVYDLENAGDDETERPTVLDNADEGPTRILTPADEPSGQQRLYAIGAVFVVEADNAGAAFASFARSDVTKLAHAASNAHAITPAMTDPDWTIELTYGHERLESIPADLEEQR